MKKIADLIIIIAFVLIFASINYGCDDNDELKSHISELIIKSISADTVDIKCVSEPFLYFAVNADDNELVFLFSKKMDTSEKGYNDLIHLGVLICSEGDIIRIFLLEHSETQGYIDYIMEEGFLNDFKGLGEEEIFGIDIISGATLSTGAIKGTISRTLKVYRENILSE